MQTLILAALVGACSAQFGDWTCIVSSWRDCSLEHEQPECGSDGITYRNRCEFTQAQCAGLKIDVSHYGKCDDRSTIGGPVIAGETAVLDYFCVELAHENCPADLDLICASTGMTYDNTCEFEKAKCTHRHISVASFGACSI